MDRVHIRGRPSRPAATWSTAESKLPATTAWITPLISLPPGCNGLPAPLPSTCPLRISEARGESVGRDSLVYDSLGIACNVRLTAVLESRDTTSTTYRWFADSADNQLASGDPIIAVGHGTIKFDGEGKSLLLRQSTVIINRDKVASRVAVAIQIGFQRFSGLETDNSTLAMKAARRIRARRADQFYRRRRRTDYRRVQQRRYPRSRANPPGSFQQSRRPGTTWRKHVCRGRELGNARARQSRRTRASVRSWPGQWNCPTPTWAAT